MIMNLKKNSVTIMMVLTMLMASLAGCLGGDNTDNTEQKVVNIAGSSTVSVSYTHLTLPTILLV